MKIKSMVEYTMCPLSYAKFGHNQQERSLQTSEFGQNCCISAFFTLNGDKISVMVKFGISSVDA